uniref:Uncharacterized protein n=1 Tax=Strix occidentalis caurina TaxID=311401 RepID=A0A8D0KQ79_STROC
MREARGDVRAGTLLCPAVGCLRSGAGAGAREDEPCCTCWGEEDAGAGEAREEHADARGEGDLLFLERQHRACWRNSAIRRAEGQRAITSPRRARAISSLRGLASACRGRDVAVPGDRGLWRVALGALPSRDAPAMLATLMTALFFAVRAFGQLGSSLFHEEPLPYLVYQPLPWQIQCVTQSRRTSRDSEKGRSSRQNSIYSISGETGNVTPDASCKRKSFSDPEKAAVTIQTHFRRYQKQKQGKK